ncbi:MAG: hypothetical protein DRQ35_02670 [Gammaproteobacteria bacterium]|nr:MAG: hypothetical protein DRQ35_02670 [Gammaproteobacteria bacterium]
MTKIASMMRCNIDTIDRGIIPVSMYALNLALSGHGKGHSTTIIEEQVINDFKTRFIEHTFPTKAKEHLHKMGNLRAAKNRNSPQLEFELVEAEFEAAGEMVFSFDSATTAAVKQLRHKLLMSNIGSMNLEIDEIGSNLLGQTDVLTTCLELYDVGKIKQKLIKNTKDNTRGKELDGRTPTNMMMFGTPVKLLDGQKTEDEFRTFLDTGYARRCIFGYCKTTTKETGQSPLDILNEFKNGTSDIYIQGISKHLGNLADPINFGINLKMNDPVTLLSIEYRIACEKLAEGYADHEEAQKAELSHRYFKCTKLAGAYAFYDQATEIEEKHFYQAMKLVEESGDSFDQILNRDRNYVRLAKYIAASKTELTHADIQEDLPFYKGGEYHRRDLLNLAIAWGYKNNVIIRKTYSDEIEFLTGESLEETNLSKMVLSYSDKITKGYHSIEMEWHELHKLTQEDGYHFVAHHLLGE